MYLLAWMIRPLDVLLHVFGIEPNVFKVAGAVKRGLVGEMRGAGPVALPAGHHRTRLDFGTKLYDGHKTVAHVAVSFLGIRRRPGTERGQRAPGRRRKANRDAGFLVVVGFLDFAG